MRFSFEDALGWARLRTLTWSREAGTHIAFDGEGIESLAEGLDEAALDAALIAIARLEPPPADLEGPPAIAAERP